MRRYFSCVKILAHATVRYSQMLWELGKTSVTFFDERSSQRYSYSDDQTSHLTFAREL